MDEYAGGVARFPWGIWQFVPIFAVGRIPNIITVARVHAFHYPHSTIKDAYIMVLSRLPRGIFYMALPINSVGRAPDVVKVFSLP